MSSISLATPFREAFHAMRHPRSFFEGQESRPTRDTIRWIFIYVLSLGMVVLVTSLIHRYAYPPTLPPPPSVDPQAQAIKKIAMEYAAAEYHFPRDVIAFSLGWPLFILFSAGVRFGFTRILAESKRSFALILFVTAVALSPVILTGSILRSFANVYPLSLMFDNPALVQIRLGIISLITVVAWLFEGLLAMKGFTITLAQNRGRAILTWLSTYAFSLFAVWFLVNFARSTG